MVKIITSLKCWEHLNAFRLFNNPYSRVILLWRACCSEADWRVGFWKSLLVRSQILWLETLFYVNPLVRCLSCLANMLNSILANLCMVKNEPIINYLLFLHSVYLWHSFKVNNNDLQMLLSIKYKTKTLFIKFRVDINIMAIFEHPMRSAVAILWNIPFDLNNLRSQFQKKYYGNSVAEHYWDISENFFLSNLYFMLEKLCIYLFSKSGFYSNWLSV